MGGKVQFTIMSIFVRSQFGNLSRPSSICVCVCLQLCVWKRDTADSVGMGEGDPRACSCCQSHHLILIPVVQLRSDSRIQGFIAFLTFQIWNCVNCNSTH